MYKLTVRNNLRSIRIWNKHFFTFLRITNSFNCHQIFYFKFTKSFLLKAFYKGLVKRKNYSTKDLTGFEPV